MSDTEAPELEPYDVFVPGDRSDESSSGKSVATEPRFKYNYNLQQAPRGKKLILLTIGHIAVFGQIYGDVRDRDILGWFPLPVEDKEAEVQSKAANNLPT